MESPTALEEKRSRLLNTAGQYVDTALREGRALRPGEDAEVTAIEMKIREIDRTLGRYISLNRDGGESGMVFARCVRACAGHRNNLEAAVQNASARRWPDVARALSASVATGGGFAVPQGYSDDVIAALRPLVSVRKLNPIIVPMGNGNLYWPRINTGATVGYISENAIIGCTQEQFGAVNLTAKKLAAIVPVSNTLIRSASPSADVIVKTDLVAALASTEDYYLLRGDGTNNTPRGLRGWVPTSNVFTAPALSGSILGEADVASVDASLSQLELALVGAGVKMIRPGWILSPRTALALKSLRTTSGARAFPEMTKDGMLKGYPFAVSTNVPTNLTAAPSGGSQITTASEIYFADFGYVVIGEFPVIIDASGQGTYTDSGSTISAFSQDTTIIRVVLQSDIGMRRDEAIAVLTAVVY
jgi:HK97 family phage major capsid protein